MGLGSHGCPSSHQRQRARRASSCSPRAHPGGPHSPSRVRFDTRASVSDANLVLFSLLGGTALLLYGVRLVGEGLQRAAGTRLRHVLSTLTGNRIKSLLVGAGVTAVLQSSSATTVMLVGFASAGLLTLRQTIGMILGADIGTTVTVQLLAFDLLQISPLLVFAGWLLYVSGRGSVRYVGQAILGFGFLFLGMKLISDGTAPLATNGTFRDVLGGLTDQPLILLLISAVFTSLVLQRQIANAHTIFNVALALVFLPFAGLAADLITRLIPESRRNEAGAMYLNPAVLDTPAVALGQALREVLRMGDVVLQSLRETRIVLERNDEALMREIVARDDVIDRLEEEIKQYLVKLREHELTG